MKAVKKIAIFLIGLLISGFIVWISLLLGHITIIVCEIPNHQKNFDWTEHIISLGFCLVICVMLKKILKRIQVKSRLRTGGVS